jgi:hypothetical protein
MMSGTRIAGTSHYLPGPPLDRDAVLRWNP